MGLGSGKGSVANLNGSIVQATHVAVVLHTAHDLRVERFFDDPAAIAAGQVRVRMAAGGICGGPFGSFVALMILVIWSAVWTRFRFPPIPA